MPPFKSERPQINKDQDSFSNAEVKVYPNDRDLEQVRATPEGLLYSLLPNTHPIIERIAYNTKLTKEQAKTYFSTALAMRHLNNYLNPFGSELSWREARSEDGEMRTVKEAQSLIDSRYYDADGNYDPNSHLPDGINFSFDNETGEMSLEVDLLRDKSVMSATINPLGGTRLCLKEIDRESIKLLLELEPKSFNQPDSSRIKILKSEDYSSWEVRDIVAVVRQIDVERYRGELPFVELTREDESESLKNVNRTPRSRRVEESDYLARELFRKLIAGANDREDFFKELIDEELRSVLSLKFSLEVVFQNKEDLINADMVVDFLKRNSSQLEWAYSGKWDPGFIEISETLDETSEISDTVKLSDEIDVETNFYNGTIRMRVDEYEKLTEFIKLNFPPHPKRQIMRAGQR